MLDPSGSANLRASARRSAGNPSSSDSAPASNVPLCKRNAPARPADRRRCKAIAFAGCTVPAAMLRLASGTENIDRGSDTKESTNGIQYVNALGRLARNYGLRATLNHKSFRLDKHCDARSAGMRMEPGRKVCSRVVAAHNSALSKPAPQPHFALGKTKRFGGCSVA